MRQVDTRLIKILMVVLPAVRRAERFPRASAALRVPVLALVPAGTRSVHLWLSHSSLHVLQQEYRFHEMAGDHAVAEFRLPGLPDADRTETFSRHGLPGILQRR